MQAWRIDAGSMEQAFQGEFDDLLGFTNHISPATCFKQHINRLQACRSTIQRIRSEGGIRCLRVDNLPVRVSVHNTTYQPTGGDGTPHTREVSRDSPLTVENHDSVERYLCPKTTELAVFRQVYEVRIQGNASPCDGGSLVPSAVQRSVQCNLAVHNDEGINVRCGSGFATNPRAMEHNRGQRITNYFVRAYSCARTRKEVTSALPKTPRSAVARCRTQNVLSDVPLVRAAVSKAECSAAGMRRTKCPDFGCTFADFIKP